MNKGKMISSDEAQSSAQQRAYGYIRDRILQGTIQGGDKLNPAEIAKILGISRMPVREALVQLDVEGLVTNRLNRGAIVTPLDPADVEELFEMRAALESIAARYAAINCNDNDLIELRIMADRMARSDKDVNSWLRLHDDFHDYICLMARKKRLETEIRRIRTAVHPYLLIYNQGAHRFENECANHQELIRALETRDGAFAEQAFRQHIINAGNGVIPFLRDRQSAEAALDSSPLI